MRNAAGLAWTSFIASLGNAVPNMLQQYNQNLETERTIRKRNQAESDVSGILEKMPKVGAAPAGMEPAQAMETWLKSSPEDKAKAAHFLSGQPVSAAQKAQATIPKMPFPEEGGALQSFANPAPPGELDDDTLNTIAELTGKVEGGGSYTPAHPRAKNGLQARGKHGIVPSIWFKEFPQFGLNPAKAEDLQRFDSTPAIQEAMAREIIKRGWKDSGGDPRKFRAWYYGGPASMANIGTPKEWEPQWATDKAGKKVQMPSVGADADNFVKLLQEAGVDASAARGVASGGFPYDNSALQALAKPTGPQRMMPRKVGYQDQERFLLENVKNPEQLGLLKDYMGMVSKAADDERTRGREDRETERENTRDWRNAVVEESRQRLDVWKTKYAGSRARGAAKDAALANLKELRTGLQKQLSDMSAWQLNYLKADEDQREILSSQFPEFFTSKPETSFFGGTKQVKGLDPNKYEKEVLRLRELINSIGAEIAPKGGVEYIPGEAGKTAQPSDYFIN